MKCRGAYTAPYRLNYGPRAGKLVSTLLSHLILKDH
jgi:hypothetical protein